MYTPRILAFSGSARAEPHNTRLKDAQRHAGIEALGKNLMAVLRKLHA